MASCKARTLERLAQPDPRNLLERIQALEEKVEKTQKRCDELETELIREKWHRQELQWQLQENHQTELERLKQQMSAMTLQSTSRMEAVTGQLRAVSSLLRVTMASEVCGPHRKSPLECLHCAIRSNSALVAFILEQSQQVDELLQSRDEKGEAPLLVAAETGDLETVKLLVERSCPESLAVTACETRQNALHYAAAFGHIEVARYLLEMKKTPNFFMDEQDDERQTPLFLACRGGHLEVAKLLVERGAKPNMVRDDGCSPLHAACFYGHRHVVEWLLEEPEVIKFLKDYEGNNAMHYAALGGHIFLMEILVKNGFSLSWTNGEGQTPLEMAKVPTS